MRTDWHQLTIQGRIDAIKAVWHPGMSAAQIADSLPGCPSRNAIIGVYHRHAKHLAAYPLQTPPNMRGRSQRKPVSNVVTLRIPKKRRRAPNEAMALMTVENRPKPVWNNDALSVEDWLKRNGGARKFEAGFSADYFGLQRFLADRGVTLVRNKSHYKIKSGRGRPRTVSWQEVCRIVDEHRVAEGLSPIKARTAA